MPIDTPQGLQDQKLAEGRLALASEFAQELNKNFRLVDRDRDGELSPLEMVNASENEKLPATVRDSCNYFDLTYSGRSWDQHSLTRFARITSGNLADRAAFVDEERSRMAGICRGAGALLSPICATVGMAFFRSPRGVLASAAVGALGTAGIYLTYRDVPGGIWDGTRHKIGNTKAGDSLLHKYGKI